MRGIPTAVAFAVALSAGAGVRAQQGTAPPMPPSLLQQELRKLDENADRVLPVLAMAVDAATTGSMSPEGWLAFYRWNDAALVWKKEKDAGAAPLLAEGVLFDCLGRLQGVGM